MRESLFLLRLYRLPLKSQIPLGAYSADLLAPSKSDIVCMCVLYRISQSLQQILPAQAHSFRLSRWQSNRRLQTRQLVPWGTLPLSLNKAYPKKTPPFEKAVTAGPQEGRGLVEDPLQTQSVLGLGRCFQMPISVFQPRVGRSCQVNSSNSINLDLCRLAREDRQE